MIVYILMLVQTNPFRTETVHSVYTSEDEAESAVHELQYQVPTSFELAIEPFEVIEEEFYE